MRSTWMALAAGYVICAIVALLATVPVGVTAQDVREETETIRASNPDLSIDEAVQAATEYLQREQRRRVTYLFLGYGLLWTLLGGYMLSISRRQARIQAELDRLGASGRHSDAT